VRDVDFALRTNEIFFPRDFELLKLDRVSLQI